MQMDWKRVACPFWVGREVLPQVEEFMYLGVLLWLEYWTIVVKKETSQKRRSRFSGQSTFPLTYGHELWVVTEGTRSQIPVGYVLP